MRPVRRGPSPIQGDFNTYDDAKPYLISRLGSYCRYCERLIATMLAVEHIQPKELYPAVEGRWENFLLSCVNCNSTKKHRDVTLSEILLPDRDNTSAAFAYTEDGRTIPAPWLPPSLKDGARRTLALTGLDKRISEVTDENGKSVAIGSG